MTMPDGSGPPAGGGFTNAPPPGPQYNPPPGPPGPPSYAMPEPAPAKKSRSGLYALVVLVVLIVLIVGGLAFFRDRISGGVTELQVGDCIDEPTTSASSITDVQHQPCTEPHDGEVFANLTYPGANDAPYPVLTTTFDDFVSTNCLPLAETYTGRTQDEIAAAGLSYAYFYPTSDSWTQNNDRGVTCYIEHADGTKMTGSVRVAAPATP